MCNGEEQHRIRDLAMEPKVLIQRQKPKLGSKPSYYCPTNWEQYEQPVETQYQTSTTRNPDGELEAVETGESRIGCLLIPAITSASRDHSDVEKGGGTIPSKAEQEKVDAPENDIEGQFRNSKLLLDQRGVAHLECRRSSSLFFPQQSKLLSRPATYGRLVVNLAGDDLVEKRCASWRESQASRPQIHVSLITIFYTGQETRTDKSARC